MVVTPLAGAKRMPPAVNSDGTAGTVFSRAQLLDMAWGYDVYVEERTVDVHMSRLRKAINKPFNDGEQVANLIRTVRGTGYALRAPADVL